MSMTQPRALAKVTTCPSPVCQASQNNIITDMYFKPCKTLDVLHRKANDQMHFQDILMLRTSNFKIHLSSILNLYWKSLCRTGSTRLSLQAAEVTVKTGSRQLRVQDLSQNPMQRRDNLNSSVTLFVYHAALDREGCNRVECKTDEGLLKYKSQ